MFVICGDGSQTNYASLNVISLKLKTLKVPKISARKILAKVIDNKNFKKINLVGVLSFFSIIYKPYK